jgi:hypothetical protein
VQCVPVPGGELILPAGETLRFGVMDPGSGRRSNTWRIWSGRAGKPSDEVYVSTRTLASEMKVSLHSSGNARLAYTSAAAPRYLPPDADRAVAKWRVAPEFVPGWRVGFKLVFPESELRAWPAPEPGEDKVTFLAAPRPGDAWLVNVFLAAPGAPVFATGPGSVPMAHLHLASGGTVAVVGREIPVDPSWYRPDTEMLVAEMRASGVNADDLPYIAVLGEQEDGTRLFTEYALALRPQPLG